jgi:hypothetical protein
MTLAKALQAAAGNTPAGDLAAAIDFDGTNDYLSRSSDMTGNANSKTFTFSCWIYPGSGAGSDVIYASSTSYFDHNNVEGVDVVLRNTSNVTVLLATLPPGSVPITTFSNLLISVDLSNTSNRYVYVNDVNITSGVTWSTYTNQEIDWTDTPHQIGAEGGGNKLIGRLSNVFLDYTYRDLSVEANRRLFITADGQPADGQAALNPIMYMPLDDPEDIGYNAGTGGDFTVNGVMARSGRGPNQYNAAASTFDGGATSTGDWMGRVLNATDSKTMSLSAKFKVDSAETSGTMFCLSDIAVGTKVVLEYNTSFGIKLTARNSSGTIIAQIDYADISKARWYQVDISVDMASTSTRHFMINGVSVGTWTTYTNDTIDFSIDAVVGQQYNDTSGAAPFAGDLSDVYFTPAYIDLSANNPFYDTDTGKPKYLGESGELPTGSSPLVYLPLRGNDAGNNLGTGGDFTVNSGPYPGARGASEFIGRSAKFSSGKYLNKSGALTGAVSNVKTFTFALAFQWDTATSSYLFRTVSGEGITTLSSGTVFRVLLDGPSGSMDARVTVSNSTSIWQTMLFSVDLADTGKRHAYVNGVSASVTWTSYPSTTYDCLLDASFGIGASPVGGDPFTGNLSFLYISQEYIDFSQEANRLKFFDAFNYPVDLGEDGSNPTGNQPVIYINNNFETGVNSGSGGNFVPQGALTAGPDVSF